MSEKYTVHYDGDGWRWKWLNIPTARFPYIVRRGDYHTVDVCPTLAWAQRSIRKDQKRQMAKLVPILTVPVDPRELPDLRTVPEFAEGFTRNHA